MKEKEIPENYVVTYRKQFTEYVIVNTFERPTASSWSMDEWDWEEETAVTTIHLESATENSSTQPSSTEVRTASDTAFSSSENTSTTATTTVTTTNETSRSSNDSNSKNSSSNSNSSSSSNTKNIAKIPQTGQLWYPVPILSCGGILMITIGIQLNKKDDDK